MSGPDRSDARLLALLEAAIFVSPEPVSLRHLAYALGEPAERVAALLEILRGELEKPLHGLILSAKTRHRQVWAACGV